MKQKFFYTFLVSFLTIFLTTSFALSDPGSSNPSLAYDSTNDQYLVVYAGFSEWNDVFGTYYGRFVGADGTFSGDEFPISGSGDARVSRVSVAFDSVNVNGQFLVAWEKHGGIPYIQGRLVAADGTLDDPFNIGPTTTSEQVQPMVAYNPDDQQFLVVWEDFERPATRGRNTYGQLVNADGSLSGSDFMINVPPGTGDPDPAQANPAVAYDAANHVYLVVWENNSEGNPGIWGRFVNSDGSLGATINLNILTARYPAIACATNQNFLVTAQSSTNLYGQLLSVGGLVGSGITISTNPGKDTITRSSVAYDSVYQNFLVVWEQATPPSDNDIYGQKVNPSDGALIDSSFPVAYDSFDQSNPSVAFNSSQANFVTAFELYSSVSIPNIDVLLIDLNVDIIPPAITLIGNNPLVLEIGTSYVEPGATALDDVDGDISAQIVFDSSSVNTAALGTYQVTYNVTDSSDNPALEVVRTVEVVDTINPTFELTTPIDGATNAPLNTNIIFHVRDSGSGVVKSTIQVTVEGVDVTGSLSFDPDTPTSLDYTATYNPADFTNGQEVNITVSATDDDGNSSSDTFSFLTIAGSPLDPGDDEDGDGIPNGVEDPTLGTDPLKKTLFIRPLEEIAANSYSHWAGFKTELFPFPVSDRPGFAYILPFENAGIEVSIIGDPAHPYAPMRDHDYDPASDPNHPPCDIVDVYYMTQSLPASFLLNNDGHTFFTGSTWSWDTKGATPNILLSSHYAKYNYHIAYVYADPLNFYMVEGAYDSSIGTGSSPVPLSSSGGKLYCTTADCDYRSPMNLNDGDAAPPYSGMPDTTVEFNEFTFDGAGEVTAIGARGPGSVRSQVLTRTTIHEIGHALIAGSNSDHCAIEGCIMSGSTIDWELLNFGAPGGCSHSAGSTKDIRADGVIHNSVH